MNNIRTYLKSSQLHSTKLDVISSIYHAWNISELKREEIIKAHLLNWTPSYFLSRLTCLAGLCELDHNGVTYEVHFMGCCLDDANRAKKVCISFRECNELGLAVALVKMIW